MPLFIGETNVIDSWHILGAGAMGRLMACKLKCMGLAPTLVLREGAASVLQFDLRDGEKVSAVDIPAVGANDIPAGSIAGMLVTTKANDAVEAVSAMVPALAAGAPVVLLNNGMGVLEALQTRFPDLALLAGTTTEGAHLTNGVLVHAGKGDTVIGQPGQDTPPPWFTAFSDSDERFAWAADIDDALWKKLLINCAINPLTALHRCRNGALLDNPALRAEVEILSEELAEVSRARGNDRGASCALDWALAVIQQTAANHSSMYKDVEQGRATEIRYITGYLVSEAVRLGIPVPHNRRLLAQLDSDTPSH